MGVGAASPPPSASPNCPLRAGPKASRMGQGQLNRRKWGQSGREAEGLLGEKGEGKNALWLHSLISFLTSLPKRPPQAGEGLREQHPVGKQRERRKGGHTQARTLCPQAAGPVRPRPRLPFCAVHAVEGWGHPSDLTPRVGHRVSAVHSRTSPSGHWRL